MIFDAKILCEEPTMVIHGRTRYAFTLYNSDVPKRYAHKEYAKRLYTIVWEAQLVSWLRNHIGKMCRFHVRLAVCESETIAAVGHLAPFGVCYNVFYNGELLFNNSQDREQGEEMYYKMVERGWLKSFFDWYPRKLRVEHKGQEIGLPYWDTASWAKIVEMNKQIVSCNP